jgi:hypothetical protein
MSDRRQWFGWEVQTQKDSAGEVSVGSPDGWWPAMVAIEIQSGTYLADDIRLLAEALARAADLAHERNTSPEARARRGDILP